MAHPRLGQFYIDGAWVDPDSTRTFPLSNPATEEQLGEIVLGNERDVDRAVGAAAQAFETWGYATKDVRLQPLRRLLEISRERIDDMAQAMTMEMGCAITFSRDVQADSAVGHLESVIDALEAQDTREALPNGDIILREPIGVCGLITPWNWPINQIVLKVVPALAAGCTCILKPSEHTPLSAVIYAEMIHDAGFPAGVFNLVQGDGPTVGAALSRHPDVHMMSFTGSTRAGVAVTKDAADTVKRVTLELGGKSPNLVFADADLETAIPASVAECFVNVGQSCDAPTRLLVEASVYDRAKELAATAVEATKIGDPTLEGDHLGPLFDKIQFDRVQEMIQIGIDEGANLLAGGTGRPAEFNAGWFVRPTLFADVTADMAVTRQEIFGPVLVMMPFETEEEAVQLANDTPYGLAAFAWTSDDARAERLAQRLRAGAVHINGGGYQYGSPFGGYKQSGNGREGGVWGIEDYQEVKTLHLG